MKILRKLVCYCLCICVFWWCVAFQGICAGAFSDRHNDTTVGSGFGDGLTGAQTQEKGYEIRLYFLDLLGKLQNFFFTK